MRPNGSEDTLKAQMAESLQDATSIPAISQRILLDHNVYATNPNSFKTWVDYIYDLTGNSHHIVNLVLTSTMCGLFVFLVGWLMAYQINFHTDYQRTPSIYAGVFGISWVIAIIRYASINIHAAYEDLRPCFLISDKEYSEKIYYWFNRLRSHRFNLITAVMWFNLAAVMVYLGFFADQYLSLITEVRAAIFLSSWFSPDNLVTKSSIILFFGLAVAIPLATSFRTLLVNFLFLLSLRGYAILPAVNIVKSRLRKLTNLYVFIAVSWFIGVSLFGFVFFTRFDLFAALFIGVLSMAGILTFLTPQLVFRGYLNDSYRRVCDMGLHILLGQLDIKLNERNYPAGTAYNIDKVSLSFPEILESTNPTDLWVYDLKDFLLLFVGQLIAILSVPFTK